MLKQSGQISLFDTYDRYNDGKKDKIRRQECLLQNNRWQYEIYYFAKDVNLINQRNGTSLKLEFDEALQEVYSSYRDLMS